MKKCNTAGCACPLCMAMQAMKGMVEGLSGSESSKHMRNAQREMLLAARAFIDERIDELDRSGSAKTGPTRIVVDDPVDDSGQEQGKG